MFIKKAPKQKIGLELYKIGQQFKYYLLPSELSLQPRSKVRIAT